MKVIRKNESIGIECNCGEFTPFSLYVFAHLSDKLVFTCQKCSRKCNIRNCQILPRKKKKCKTPTSNWNTVLKAFDPEYFSNTTSKTIDDAADNLAAWFIDNRKLSSLKSMIKKLPPDLWTLVLQKWGNR